MTRVSITAENREHIMQWLLQCNAEDFQGPLDSLMECYAELDTLYTHYQAKKKDFKQWQEVSTQRLVQLAQHLCAHLNAMAKQTLQEKLKTLPSFTDNRMIASQLVH